MTRQRTSAVLDGFEQRQTTRRTAPSVRRRTSETSVILEPLPTLLPKPAPLHGTDRASHGPSEDEIRTRAYQIYRARGMRPGSALEDWLQAERELRNGVTR